MGDNQINTKLSHMDHGQTKPPPSDSEFFTVDDSDLRVANRLLILCSLGLVVLVVFRVFEMEKRLSAQQPVQGGALYTSPAIRSFESAEDYEASVSGRSIMYSTQRSGSSQDPVTTLSPRSEIIKRLEQARRELVVVGVAWKPPEVVMLLDKKSRKTYQLRVGQKIGNGEVIVESISREEIILSLEKEKVVISL